MWSPAQASKSDVTMDADGVPYRELNERIVDAVRRHQETVGDSGDGLHLSLCGVCGQRYVACALRSLVHIHVEGVPGNDLAAFADGPTITTMGNVQDGTANTMNSGLVVVHGSAGDILGYAMRGGEVFVRDHVGYRVGIHMKSYAGVVPVIVVGGRAGDFLGEYMAGGIILVLGRGRGAEDARSPVGELVGTGMHGGVIYVRGPVDDTQLGKEVGRRPLDEGDRETISRLVCRYVEYFGSDASVGLDSLTFDWGEFTKLLAVSHRPYGQLYAY